VRSGRFCPPCRLYTSMTSNNSFFFWLVLRLPFSCDESLVTDLSRLYSIQYVCIYYATLDTFTPYIEFVRAAYCDPNKIAGWECGGLSFLSRLMPLPGYWLGSRCLPRSSRLHKSLLCFNSYQWCPSEHACALANKEEYMTDSIKYVVDINDVESPNISQTW